jgi:hypothetical protein
MSKTTDIPFFDGNVSFNAQHAALGAFFSFTCGHFGTRGGFGLQIGTPGNQDLFIGVKDGDRFSRSPLKVLPFFEGAATDEAARYDVEKKTADAARPMLQVHRRGEIRRQYGLATDRWTTPDFSFALYTPFFPLPEPTPAAGEALRLAILPAIIGELTIDNTAGAGPKTAIFAINFTDRGTRMLDDAGRVVGFALGRSMGVRAIPDPQSSARPLHFMRWTPESGVADPSTHLLGTCPGIGVTVPAGERYTLRLAIGAHLDGVVTTRLEGRYLYTREWPNLEAVLAAAAGRADVLVARARELDAELLASRLSPAQQFILAHAARSYHGSTQLLDVGGEPFWIVNEGEYVMINTLDLSVDQVFWELKHNPWVVRNLLENFVRHYSYVDQVKVPTPEAIERIRSQHVASADVHNTPRTLGTAVPLELFELRDGGISFCHDMGSFNQFSPFGNSSYELSDLVGCFSYMTAEQLCNWILMATCYVAKTGDVDWARRQRHVIDACHRSLQNRCTTGQGEYVGSPGLDSGRCRSGSEITTYDSLDHSLAQTRNNLYMAVKVWASWYGLYRLHEHLGDRAMSERAEVGAAQAARSVTTQLRPDGWIPAVFEPGNPGQQSRILPAIEGLVYVLYCCGCEHRVHRDDWHLNADHASLIAALRTHAATLLGDEQQRNNFADGGLRLSSTSDNSWMSKIALAQHVARRLLRLDEDPQIRERLERADRAHVAWQTEPQGKSGSAYWACSDQIVNGVAAGSKYYPRIVTSVLWMEE